MRLIVFMFGLGAAINAQTVHAPFPSVTAHGEAVVTATPDRVRVDIGVVTQAGTAEAAGTQNAQQTAVVIQSLKKALGASADVQTSGYSLHPNYRHTREGGTPTITGYTATNMVQVTSSDVAGIGKVIDAATKAGANNIHGVHFHLKDEQAVRSRALGEATQRARANAESMAAGLGMKLGRVFTITDGQPVHIVPVRSEMLQVARAAAADTPIEPGTMQVRATVALTAELVR
jgi:uncharacterized protein YggE